MNAHASRECNFSMGTISGMGFAQAQVHTVHSMSAEATSAMSCMHECFPKIVPMAKLHSLLACAFMISTYNNLLLTAKGRKKNLSNCSM